ncbi:hypothetical protein [Kitasatospora sp. NPDC093679]|uniref:hypothetical protein n=1 Tax=Kitasatospora sp. NPDC093679 TaxID=3154983 RepID=UPI00341CFEFA
MLIDAEAVVHCYDAVREALPELAVLLNSDSSELRAYAGLIDPVSTGTQGA